LRDDDVTTNDPTDDALAAIASILERPVAAPDAQVETRPVVAAEVETDAEPAEAALAHTAPAEVETPTVSIAPDVPEIEVERYARVGPGPLDAIRFRWAARRDDNGDYYVDETIGPNSRPMASGPMPRAEVVAFIDERAAAAQRRFDALKLEMSNGVGVPDDRHDPHGES
jgi:hypothetical protein